MKASVLARHFIKAMPRSRRLYQLCQFYCDEFANHGSENNGDPETNGEYRLLRELAPGLRTVFDVGANVGDWTAKVQDLQAAARVHAFEPSVGTFARLSRRGFSPAVTLNNTALSAEAGEATLYLFGEADGGNALHLREGLEDGWGSATNALTENIRLDTLDGYCARHEIDRIDFLKIDTEGHEVSVLEGGRDTLARGRARVVQFEYGGTYIDARRLLKDVFDLLKDRPYTVFSIAPDRLIAHPRYDQRLENFRYKNLAAVRSDAIATIASAREAMSRAKA